MNKAILDRMLSVFLACLLCSFAVHGAVTLCDFENTAEIAACPVVDAPSFSVSITNAFAFSGTNALHFSCSAWKEGDPQWPSFTLKSSVADWTGYDRLVVDVMNCGNAHDRLWVYVAEAEGRIQRGLEGVVLLPVHGRTQMVVPLEKWPKTCNPRNIARIHFFTERPVGFDVFLDRVMLLKKGESSPIANSPCIARDLVTFLEERAAKAEHEADAANNEQLHETCYWRLREACTRTGQDTAKMFVGMASSMVKIRPRSGFAADPATNVAMRIARNERESMQILVAPGDVDLSCVSVEVGELLAEDGTCFAATNVVCSPVGYVNITNLVPYRVGFAPYTGDAECRRRETKVPERGWWPDPILAYLECVDIKGRDVQSFWVRVTCPAQQKAGVYRGALVVRAKGIAPVTVPFAVRIENFAVPRESPLPLAITFWPEPDFDDPVHAKIGKELLSDPKAPCNAWKNNKAAWVDFLADYYITMDSLYGRSRTQWDALLRLKRQGRLGRFNLGYWSCPEWSDGDEAAGQARWRRGNIDLLRANYRKAAELGLLDRAYLYGCDELKSEHFSRARWAVEELKREFPGIPVSTTAYDGNFGVGSELAGVDWFVPLTPKFDCAKADAARKEGRKVWWYICCGPHAPYANMYIECPAIEGRLLMGAQTVRMRPDGFLYYEISIWNMRRPLSGGPFTDWNPVSWTSYNGDGSWTCIGPGGMPIATQRLENFRDGLEDYAYALELERRLGECPDQDSDWARRARVALAVPKDVMVDMTSYTDDPAAVYRWRNAMADLIEEANPRCQTP